MGKLYANPEFYTAFDQNEEGCTYSTFSTETVCDVAQACSSTTSVLLPKSSAVTSEQSHTSLELCTDCVRFDKFGEDVDSSLPLTWLIYC